MELLVRAFPTNENYVRQLAGYYQLDERPRLAIRLMDELIKKNREGWRNYRLRGDARLSVGEHLEAIQDYERALAVIEKSAKGTPDGAKGEADDERTSGAPREEHAGLLNNLAWVLATSPKEGVRDGKKSLEFGLKACELSDYKEAHILSTLAAGYAESGDFEKAREWSAKAVELGQSEDNEQLEQLKKELESYKENKAWREEQKTEENKKPRVKSDTIET
jgi:tetratricopeptide (TPR) repeat protein